MNTLQVCKEHAISKGGLFLSTEYKNNHTKMLWKCANPNHIPWESSYSNVIGRNNWCPRCAGRFTKEEKLEMAKKHAESRDGKCLSTEYVNSHSRMKWECKNGHQWETRFSKVIFENTWCPKCKKN